MLTGVTEPRDDGSRDLVIGLCRDDWEGLLKNTLYLDDILPGYTIVLVATEEERSLTA
jgi:hypothetical protein